MSVEPSVGAFSEAVPPWLDFANAWAAIPIAIIGFAWAIIQASRAQGSAAAAQAAAESTQSQIGSNLLLVVLPQLREIETNLEWAVKWAITSGDSTSVSHYLGAWRWQAGNVRGHLKADDETNEDFLTKLQSSIAIAADTKFALQTPEADVAKRTRAVMQAIAQVTGSLGELTAKNALEGRPPNGK